MSNSSSTLMDLYNTIKAQEVNFPLPTLSATVKVGTFNAATGQFIFAPGWQVTTEVLSWNPNAPPPKPVEVRRVGIEGLVDAVNATLLFEVVESQGKFTVDFGGMVSETTGTSLTFDVGSADALDPGLSMSSGSKTWSAFPPPGMDPHTRVYTEYAETLINRPPIIGAGAFTVPALPVVIVYDPPADSRDKNAATYQFAQTTGVTATSAFSEQDSTANPVPAAWTDLATISNLMTAAANALGVVDNPYAKGAAAALFVIASGLGSVTATQTQGTSVTTTDALTITNMWSQTISTESGTGGPGKGDVMYFLRNARLVWLAQNGRLFLALLGWDSNPSVTAEFLQQNGAGLDTGTIQALLNLDPLVPSPSGPLNVPRFVYVETVELQGSDQTYTFSHSVTVQDTQDTTSFTTKLIDERQAWLSFLGIGPSQTQTTTSTVTQTISSATTVGEVTTVTASFYATASEFYAVTVYYDTVFGAFAFTPAPVGFQPIISGILRNGLGQPDAMQVVTLINTGRKFTTRKPTTRKFTTRTNAQGQFAFYSTTIEPGDLLLVAGAARKQFVFSGRPLQDLELHP